MLHKGFTVSEKQPRRPEVLQGQKFTRLLLAGAQGNEKAHWAFLGEKFTTHSCASREKQPYLVFLKE